MKGSSDERWQRLLRGDDLPQFAHRKLALRDISTVPPSAAKNLKRRDSAHHHSGRSRLHRRVVPRVPRNTDTRSSPAGGKPIIEDEPADGQDRFFREKTLEIVERETGIEPATTGLGSRCSTIELLPLCWQSISQSPPALPHPIPTKGCAVAERGS